MKKIITLLLLFPIIGIFAFAQTATIGSVTANPGTVVIIPVTLDGLNGANSPRVFHLNINYDYTQLSSGSIVNFNPLLTYCMDISWYCDQNHVSVVGTGTQIVNFPDNTIIFEIQSTNTGNATTLVTWNTTVSKFLNLNGNNINVNWVNGSISPNNSINAPILVSLSNNTTNVTP